MTSCISTMNVIAQDKKSFTLEDLMPGGNNYFNLQPLSPTKSALIKVPSASILPETLIKAETDTPFY